MAAAAVLISMGAVLGKTTVFQLIFMALVETALYVTNLTIGIDHLQVNTQLPNANFFLALVFFIAARSEHALRNSGSFICFALALLQTRVESKAKRWLSELQLAPEFDLWRERAYVCLVYESGCCEVFPAMRNCAVAAAYADFF